jgi:two-component system sensor histidine kinase ChvG
MADGAQGTAAGGAAKDATGRDAIHPAPPGAHRAPPSPTTRPRPSPLSPTQSLLRRILFINAIGLGLLVGGVLYLNQFREGLIDLRGEALRTQGAIIAIAIAEAAGQPGPVPGVDPVRANLVLRRLASPAGVRARLYDRRGRLIGDTRSFGDSAGEIEVAPLPPIDSNPPIDVLNAVERAYGALVDWFTGAPELYSETTLAGIATEAEVYAALDRQTVRTVRANSEGELIVSVALPIQRLKAVKGALVVSTVGGDIDAIVRAERIAILRVALVATLVSLALSAFLARTIARPLRRLAEAATRSGALGDRPVTSTVDFPDYTSRADEIGQLSGALRHMARALGQRIEAIERFAADVAHEIKNPLTSLRSAVETLPRAGTEEHRAELMAVIADDVRRLDRLVTDISNASRLDAELSRDALEPVAVDQLLAAIADITEGDAHARGVTVRASPSARPLDVLGLEGRLGQVFLNLAGNAISLSPPGGTVALHAAAREDGMVAIMVDDEGPGIPEENLERIFERFYTSRPEGDGAGKRPAHHSGLGLSISRQIIEAHGGQLWAENRAAGGARFTALLPAARP